MREFNYKNIKKQLWDNETLSLISTIHEEMGKEKLYLKENKYNLSKLIEISKIQSTESSSRIEGVVTTSNRLKQILNEKSAPKNRSEEEILGYRDALNLIHSKYDSIKLNPSTILKLHKILFSYSLKVEGGVYKEEENYISAIDKNGNMYTIFTPLEPYLVPQAIENICNEYNKIIDENSVDPLLLIPYFIQDFLCIHPFKDGNGRVSRLLTTLLLYKSNIFIGKYISIEHLIEIHKENYYLSLLESDKGWNENKENKIEFITYFLRIILKAYKELEERISILDNSSSLNIVKNAIDSILGSFNKQDLISFCPTLSVKTIELALKNLTNDGYIEKIGKGKNTKYLKK